MDRVLNPVSPIETAFESKVGLDVVDDGGLAGVGGPADDALPGLDRHRFDRSGGTPGRRMEPELPLVVVEQNRARLGAHRFRGGFNDRRQQHIEMDDAAIGLGDFQDRFQLVDIFRWIAQLHLSQNH